MKNLCYSVIVSMAVCVGGAAADSHESVSVAVNAVDATGVGASLGTIEFKDVPHGIEVKPNLHGLAPGEHGFHIHENPTCEPKEKDGKMTAAQAAGGHFDPRASGKHAGPHGGGHQGDLPKLDVAADGTATKALHIHGLALKDIRNRSVVIHAGGDNYSDSPAPLGGGGPRVGCGVVPQ